MDIKRGDIVFVNLPRNTKYNIQSGGRPCVVVQNNTRKSF